MTNWFGCVRTEVAGPVVSFLGNNLAGMISSLESVKGLFLLNYFEATGDALINGQHPANLLTLMLVALAALGLAILFFQRRDITVGAWPWQRGRLPARGTGGA